MASTRRKTIRYMFRQSTRVAPGAGPFLTLWYRFVGRPLVNARNRLATFRTLWAEYRAACKAVRKAARLAA